MYVCVVSLAHKANVERISLFCFHITEEDVHICILKTDTGGEKPLQSLLFYMMKISVDFFFKFQHSSERVFCFVVLIS